MRASLEVAETFARNVVKNSITDTPGWGCIVMLASSYQNGYMTYSSSIEKTSAVRCIEEWMKTVNNDGNNFIDRTKKVCWCCESDQHLTTMHGPHRSIILCKICVGSKRDLNEKES